MLTTRARRTGPAPRHEIAYRPDLVVPDADGGDLLADHWFPVDDGPFPTVLIRSPYGRGFPWAGLYGARLAEQGFHVLLQACRDSRDGAELWRHEAADGHAAVAWLRRQPWFTGAFGTVGPSYLAYVQWALALDPPPELRAVIAQVGVHDPHDAFYPGGAFALENALVAGVGMTSQARGAVAFLRAALRLRRHLGRITRTLPLRDAYVPGFGRRVAVIEGPLTHPEPDDAYWAGTDVGAAADTVTVPVTLISGWHDIALDQTLRQYARLRRAGRAPRLLIGPWTHTSFLEVGWSEVFPETVAALRAQLTGDTSGPRPAPVRVYVGGGGGWRDLPDWPPPTAVEQRRYLHGDRLQVDPPGAAWARSWRYDPADPTPSLGGPLLSRRAGERDNTRLEARADVLLFTSEPLAAAVEVLGAVRVELDVDAVPGHADVFARLCDVDLRGRSRNVCDGLLRLPADHTGAVRVAMSATAYRFAAGHRIRLQLSGGAHPRFARNTGSGEPVATATRLVPVDITVRRPSVLVVPTVPAG
jgi:putative CocE/NonD family hydrolase